MRKIYMGILFVCLTAYASAADRYWVGGTSGNWNSTANWSATSGGTSGASVPGANDNVIFDNGLTVSVTYDLASNDVGFSGFSVINNSTITLTNTVSSTRSLTINNNGSTYYTVVATGSTLILKSNTNSVFNFGSSTLSNGRMVINGTIRCENQSVNTSSGPRLNAQDSIIINGTYYAGPAITQNGSNPTGSKFRFSSGSLYQLDKNGGVVPGGKWERGSLIKITGTTSAFPATWLGSGIYGSVEIDAPGANGTVSTMSLPTNTTFQGDFKVTNTGTIAALRFATTANNITIDGNFIVNSGTVSLANSASTSTVTVNGDFIQGTGTTLDLQASTGTTTFTVKGAVNTVGTITELGSSTTSTVVLGGTNSQTLSFGSTSIANDVRFQLNNAAGAVATTDWNMPSSSNSQLTLTLGNINMGANTLYLQNPAATALSGGTVNSHIIGKLRRATNTTASAYSFPVSDIATEFATVNITPATASSNYTVSFTRPNPYNRNAVPAGILQAGNYLWDITQNTGTGANLNFDFGNFANGGITDVNAVRALHWNGASWDNLGGTYVATNTLDVTGVTSFSPFTLGSVVDLLPVRFAHIKATLQGGIVKVDWSNLTETNVKNYTVERSADGIHFSSLQLIPAAGNTNSRVDYTATDGAPFNGVNYYRIRATEQNGSFFFSTIVRVQTNQEHTDLLLYPNPAVSGGLVSLQSGNLPKGSYQLLLVNAAGQVVQRQTINHSGGAVTQTLPLPVSVKSGYYTVQVVSETMKWVQPLMIK
ncbi:MAG: T9SS type A sorting domain-containing protein [Bacteroidetes bacterium]|nr:T9SS type A sorting domain-containing protein [Bacteroidota bacterium]